MAGELTLRWLGIPEAVGSKFQLGQEEALGTQSRTSRRSQLHTRLALRP